MTSLKRRQRDKIGRDIEDLAQLVEDTLAPELGARRPLVPERFALAAWLEDYVARSPAKCLIADLGCRMRAASRMRVTRHTDTAGAASARAASMSSRKR